MDAEEECKELDAESEEFLEMFKNSEIDEFTLRRARMKVNEVFGQEVFPFKKAEKEEK